MKKNPKQLVAIAALAAIALLIIAFVISAFTAGPGEAGNRFMALLFGIISVPLYYCRSYFGVADFILHRKNAGEAYNGRIFTGTGYGNGKRQLTILCPPFSFNIYRTFYFINTLAVQCTAGTVQLKHKIPRKTEIGKIPALFRQISEHARFYPLWLSAGF